MKKRYLWPPPATQPAYFVGPVIELHAEDDLYPSNGTIEAEWIYPITTIIELHAEDEQIRPQEAPEGDEKTQSS